MLASFVLRLRRDALGRGVVAGEIEDVEAGTRIALRSLEDLVAFLTTAVTERTTHPSPTGSSTP